MGWVKCEGMHSKESGIRDESLEGSVIGHLVSKYIGSEFGIRDVFLFHGASCAFFVRGRITVIFFVMHAR